MAKDIQKIQFSNKDHPRSYFEVIRIEELLRRELDHDPSKNHIVKFYNILFITAGESYHTIDFTDYKLNKGTILFVRKDQIHKFFRSPNVTGYLLIFTEEFIVSHLNELEALKSFQLFNELLSFPKVELKAQTDEYANFATFVEQLDHEYHRKDEYSIGITRSLLHILITKLYRIKESTHTQAKRIKYLEEFLQFQSAVEASCFENKKVSDYAKKLGVSTKTLNNITQAIVKKPAKTFIDEIAIIQIKRLLISTHHPIKHIAYEVGFEDPANFFKYFKKYTGTSPDVFRQAHQ